MREAASGMREAGVVRAFSTDTQLGRQRNSRLTLRIVKPSPAFAHHHAYAFAMFLFFFSSGGPVPAAALLTISAPPTSLSPSALKWSHRAYCSVIWYECVACVELLVSRRASMSV